MQSFVSYLAGDEIFYSSIMLNCAIHSSIPRCVCVVSRQGALELERMLEQRKEEEEAWHRQQRLLLEAEEQRRAMMEVEETKLTDQRTR